MTRGVLHDLIELWLNRLLTLVFLLYSKTPELDEFWYRRSENGPSYDAFQDADEAR